MYWGLVTGTFFVLQRPPQEPLWTSLALDLCARWALSGLCYRTWLGTRFLPRGLALAGLLHEAFFCRAVAVLMKFLHQILLTFRCLCHPSVF